MSALRRKPYICLSATSSVGSASGNTSHAALLTPFEALPIPLLGSGTNQILNRFPEVHHGSASKCFEVIQTTSKHSDLPRMTAPIAVPTSGFQMLCSRRCLAERTKRRSSTLQHSSVPTWRRAAARRFVVVGRPDSVRSASHPMDCHQHVLGVSYQRERRDSSLIGH